jgi:hypothetical protein
MSEETKNFIDKLAAGDNAGAGEAFKDALRVKVGQTLDNHRKDMAGNMFNQTDNPIPEAEAHSDPKPEIADPGTFDRDGNVLDTTGQKDGQAELDLTDNGTPDTMVGVDVNASEPNS